MGDAKAGGPTRSQRFAQRATRLAVRTYGFPGEAERDAFVDGFDDCGFDGLALALGDHPILDAETAETAIEEAGDQDRLRLLMLQAKARKLVYVRDVDDFAAASKRWLALDRDTFLKMKIFASSTSASSTNRWKLSFHPTNNNQFRGNRHEKKKQTLDS